MYSVEIADLIQSYNSLERWAHFHNAFSIAIHIWCEIRFTVIPRLVELSLQICIGYDSTFLRYDFFQNLTLKIQGQGHRWGERWKSEHGSNILSTHIHFVPCQSVITFLRYDFFKIWPWKCKANVMVGVKAESHKVGVTSYRLTSRSFDINRPFHFWDTNF